MGPIISAVLGNVSAHAEAYRTALEVIVLAVASTMPASVPRSIQEWWTWMRSAIRAAVPVRHVEDPQQPVGPAKD